MQYRKDENDIPAEKKGTSENYIKISKISEPEDPKTFPKNSLNESKIKFSFNSVKEESFISQTFFGKMNQTITYIENQHQVFEFV